MAKKKLALVNVFFPPQTIGGATRVVSDNFDVLKQNYEDEYEVVVFTSHSDVAEPYLVDKYAYKGSRVYRVTAWWRENMDWHYEDPKMGEIFRQFLEFERPDLVHFHCIQRLSTSILDATRELQIPYLITVHDAWWISDFQFLVDSSGKVYPEGHLDAYEELLLPNGISREASLTRRLCLERQLNQADQVVTVSQAFTDLYQKQGVDIISNRNGISDNVKWGADRTSDDKVVCAHIGGMSEHKGYHLFKRALMSVSSEQIEGLVVDLAHEEGYERIEYWNQTRVRFVGRVGQENIAKLYAQINVLFAPSIWPESYGLVTREAAASGCWVVASNIGAIGEDVADKKNGYVIEPGNFKDIREVLLEIETNPEKFKNPPEYKSGIRYSSEQVAELVKIYDGLMFKDETLDMTGSKLDAVK